MDFANQVCMLGLINNFVTNGHCKLNFADPNIVKISWNSLTPLVSTDNIVMVQVEVAQTRMTELSHIQVDHLQHLTAFVQAQVDDM